MVRKWFGPRNDKAFLGSVLGRSHGNVTDEGNESFEKGVRKFPRQGRRENPEISLQRTSFSRKDRRHTWTTVERQVGVRWKEGTQKNIVTAV